MEVRTGGDQPGVTVVICDGHRCHALQGRTDTGVVEGEAATLLGALRARVRATRRAVLIRSGCLGACEKAPVVMLSRRGGSVPGIVFGPVEQPGQVRAVLDAVRAED